MNFFELLPSEKINLGDVVYKYDTNQKFNTDLLCIADSEDRLNKSKFVKVKTKSIDKAEPGDAFVFNRDINYEYLFTRKHLNPRKNETRYIESINAYNTIKYELYATVDRKLSVQPSDVSIISTIKVLDIDSLLSDKEKIIVSVENNEQLNLLLTSLYAYDCKTYDHKKYGIYIFDIQYFEISKNISFKIEKINNEKIFEYAPTQYYIESKKYTINKFEDLFPDAFVSKEKNNYPKTHSDWWFESGQTITMPNLFDSKKLYECLEAKYDESSQKNINQIQNKENKMQNLQEIIKQIFGGTDYSKKPQYLVLVYSPDESICAQGSADSLESIEKAIASDYRLVGHKVVAYKIKAELESKIPVAVTKIKKEKDTETQEPDGE